eukprot:gnl/MRDRNA2_/MRDRNA2_157737_c0_seq1.p1 gnl/MRDRNA2_/MRDRNA2_157737_c0~~gnl/MRDRNA2_/MRDRNA2_157737_c0_seq1.p1  ORF type:complete len:488 (-),score=72.35 gnl/MRDRNA2_/MRDRNA2_157737_c0_seq1:94-1557(-)
MHSQELAAMRIQSFWRRYISQCRRFQNNSDLREFIEACIQNPPNQRPGLEVSEPTCVEEHLSCPVCHCLLFRPVVTICSHRFCKSCLSGWQEVEVRNGREDWHVLRCPMCRRDLGAAEASAVNCELENEIIQRYGVAAYQARRKSVVAGNVERALDRASNGRDPSASEMTAEEQALQQARARSWEDAGWLAAQNAVLWGTVFGGPLGMVVGGVVGGLGMAGARAHSDVQHWTAQQATRFALIEDELEQDEDGTIRVLNMSLSSVHVHLEGLERTARPIDASSSVRFVSVEIRPSCTGIVGDKSEYADKDIIAFRIAVTLTGGLLEVPVLVKPVVLGQGFILCGTDQCVQPLGRLSIQQGPNSPVHVRNAGDMVLKLVFCKCDAAVSWFSFATVSLAPGEARDVIPEKVAASARSQVSLWANDEVSEVSEFKTWIYAVNEENGDEHEVTVVEMRRGQGYSLKGCEAPPTWQFMRSWGTSFRGMQRSDE